MNRSRGKALSVAECHNNFFYLEFFFFCNFSLYVFILVSYVLFIHFFLLATVNVACGWRRSVSRACKGDRRIWQGRSSCVLFRKSCEPRGCSCRTRSWVGRRKERHRSKLRSSTTHPLNNHFIYNIY